MDRNKFDFSTGSSWVLVKRGVRAGVYLFFFKNAVLGLGLGLAIALNQILNNPTVTLKRHSLKEKDRPQPRPRPRVLLTPAVARRLKPSRARVVLQSSYGSSTTFEADLTKPLAFMKNGEIYPHPDKLAPTLLRCLVIGIGKLQLKANEKWNQASTTGQSYWHNFIH